MTTNVLLRADSVSAVSNSIFSLSGLVPFDSPEVLHSAPSGVSFVELAEDIISKHHAAGAADTATLRVVFQDASQGQDSCSAISSNMDFETFTGTGESTMQLGCGAPVSWTSDQSTAAGAGAPLNAAFGALDARLYSLFTGAISDDEVMSMAFPAPSEAAKPEQVQALAELFRNDSLDPPDLSALGSRDSVYSAPELEARPDYPEPHQQLAAAEPNAALQHPVSAAVPVPVSMDLLSRSLSVAAPQQLGRSYSTAGPGTNRPPKDGSQSALLPKDKLNRKRAAARRYYHNQRNKAVDYEVAITRLETENQALSQELVDALKKLEHLKKSDVTPMSVC